MIFSFGGPVVTQEARRIFCSEPCIRYVSTPMDALQGADVLALVTEWQEFRAPDFDEIKAKMKQPIAFDGRNLYDPAILRKAGLEHLTIGRKE